MKKRLLMFLVGCFLSIGAALGQNKITGTVYDDMGEPAIGATVLVQGFKD